mgnify:CR=1 FL=1
MILKEKAREWQRNINNIELWDMRYLENYIAKFSQYYYKIEHNKTNLGKFYDKLPYPINFIINEKYIAWLKRTDVVDTLGSRNLLFTKMDQWLVSWSQKVKEN